ncbi:MAG TPA: hypothetical protein EYN79_08925 [Planctomycetes bacterium]|nr:hypothetical protein [Planctomycetota bacterium]HIN80466.1 hypothetical protein [Planctomycetota bacterium]
MTDSISRSSSGILCAGLLLAFLVVPSLCTAQFNPSLSTTFDNLQAGQPSGFTQAGFFPQGGLGPSAMVIQFDRGSFDFSGYAPGDLVGGLVVDVFVQIVFIVISGEIIAEVQVTSVGPDTMEAIAVVTEITGNVGVGLSLLGLPDPLGETAFNVIYTDLPGDSGATMVVTDAGSLPLSGTLDFDVPLTWSTPAILTHSPFGGDLAVDSVLTSSSGIDVFFNELFPLSGGSAPQFIRGDSNGDGSINLADAISVLGYLFSGQALGCLASVDVNDSGGADISDAIALLDYLFGGGGGQLPPPFPNCGPDPTAGGSLTCETPPACP